MAKGSWMRIRLVTTRGFLRSLRLSGVQARRVGGDGKLHLVLKAASMQTKTPPPSCLILTEGSSRHRGTCYVVWLESLDDRH